MCWQYLVACLNVEFRNQNFNKFSSRRNVCGCEHGGECLERSRTCFCSHGFTGDRCQKRVRKASNKRVVQLIVYFPPPVYSCVSFPLNTK